MPDSTARPVGGTEYSWCKSVLSGTGITVLGLLLSKSLDVSLLQTALHNIQISHPILRSRLRLDASANTFHFITPPDPHIRITQFDLQYTSRIIGSESSGDPIPISPFHRILEYELNQNSWRDHSGSMSVDSDLFHANLYRVSDHQWALFLRLHTSACDRTSAVALLKELLDRVGGGVKEGEGTEMELERKGKARLAIEDLIPEGKTDKPFWARGLDVVGYSLNSFRFSNLVFVDADSPRGSKVAKLHLDKDETERLIVVSNYFSFQVITPATLINNCFIINPINNKKIVLEYCFLLFRQQVSRLYLKKCYSKTRGMRITLFCLTWKGL